jgi:hypothetical protein
VGAKLFENKNSLLKNTHVRTNNSQLLVPSAMHRIWQHGKHHGTNFTCNNGKYYGLLAKPTTLIAQEERGASPVCRNHEPAL